MNQIDCQYTSIVHDLIDNDIVYLKNVRRSSFSTLIKQIRSKGQHNVIIAKDGSIDLIYDGACLHHYDCLLKRKDFLSNLFYKNFQVTRNFPQFMLNAIKTNNDQHLMKILIEMTFLTHSSLVTKLLNELLQQISTKSTTKLNKYQFEIP
ncbi:unnamed protein product [Adineta steineri]|uniref:Uncharacterized protein n=1 Tax=Adineta steineri TaxID=433720 RepID=A0A814AAL8_9BILA|nr:unnamed protein product [Adineta steineri]CAF1374759.1 unnamed protein product [Adineta steineri]